MNTTEILQNLFADERHAALNKKVSIVWALSVPAILAQLTSIVMQYIDAAMVGKLGADGSASIGVVASSTWLVYGLGSAFASGFSVQVAQSTGERNFSRTKFLARFSVVCVLVLSLAAAFVCASISFHLPVWLHSDASLHRDASVYFLIFSLSQPFVMLTTLCLGILECSGNMKLPSILSGAMCVLDVVFNGFFIFVLKLGVAGAALGTAVSQALICFVAIYYVLFRSEILKIEFRNNPEKKSGNDFSVKTILGNAKKIALPMTFEEVALCGAQIFATRIIAPLGTVALAAHSFAVTAEALCYMPGYGISSAATALVGQSIGSGRKEYAKSFSRITVLLGMIVMGIAGLVMYFTCPWIFKFFTPDADVQKLATDVLRIEILAEPLFAASIISAGALRGAGDTVFPAAINLVSMWGIRLTLTYFLSKYLGLRGAWLAMCIELCVRGILYLIRLRFQKWNRM